MQVLTAFILAAFVGYGASWYFGVIDGNFALLLFMATVVTGIYWLAERFYFLPQRLSVATKLDEEAAKRARRARSHGYQASRRRRGASARTARHATLVAGLDRRH